MYQTNVSKLHGIQLEAARLLEGYMCEAVVCALMASNVWNHINSIWGSDGATKTPSGTFGAAGRRAFPSSLV